MLLGTAFDYLLRFELQRRAPHAISRRLVAESVPDRIWQKGTYIHLSKDDKGVVSLGGMHGDPYELEELAKEVAERTRKVVEKAKAAIAAYLKTKEPDRSTQAALAGHAIRLAKLEDFVRSYRFDNSFEDADPEDVEELIDLLAVVPWDDLLHDKVLLLNPTFGESSSLVGGADADLIQGDTLIDFKTIKTAEVKPEYLNQLLGYLLLDRNQRRTDQTFPEIKRLALYFTRHGHVWVQDVTFWTSNPDFPELERWFFDHAKEVFGHS
jgi:hypothetical protein